MEVVTEPNKAHLWKAGQSGNPSGRPAGRFMTEALQMYLLRPADLPVSKPRNAAEAIARQMVKQAVEGCTTSQSTIYDRMEGKAIQTVKAEIEQKPVDIMDACRRLAFIINSAQALGQPLPPEYALLINPPVSDAELVEVSQEIIDNQ
jgi:hypothetical protein